MLKQGQINHLNSPISPEEIEVFINSLPNKNKQTNKQQQQQQNKTQDQMGLVGNSIRSSKKT